MNIDVFYLYSMSIQNKHACYAYTSTIMYAYVNNIINL